MTAPGVDQGADHGGPAGGGAMRVDSDQRCARLEHAPHLGEGAAHQFLVVRVGLRGVAAGAGSVARRPRGAWAAPPA